MYAQQPYSFPGSFVPGAPIVSAAPFSTDGLQFSRIGFPGINHTQLPPITYVRDECWSPRIREVRRSPSPQRRCVSYSSRDSSARLEPESILRQPGLSRQPSPGPDTAQPFPLPRRFKKEFPPLGASGLAQSASIKKNNEQQNNINTKRTKLKFSQSNFVFENISRHSKF